MIIIEVQAGGVQIWRTRACDILGTKSDTVCRICRAHLGILTIEKLEKKITGRYCVSLEPF